MVVLSEDRFVAGAHVQTRRLFVDHFVQRFDDPTFAPDDSMIVVVCPVSVEKQSFLHCGEHCA